MYIWIKINLSSKRIHVSILCTPVKLELLNHSAPLATRKPKTSEIITKFNVPNTPVSPLYWPRSCPTSLLKDIKAFYVFMICGLPFLQRIHTQYLLWFPCLALLFCSPLGRILSPGMQIIE